MIHNFYLSIRSFLKIVLNLIPMDWLTTYLINFTSQYKK